MDDRPLTTEEASILQKWATENITTTFFKCTRWQVEETTDLLNCPFHYFCDSSYAGNFPPIIDLSAIAVVAASFFTSTMFTALGFRTRGESFGRRKLERRYFLPSGPVLLPLMLLMLANGERINTLFPISRLGPSILLLIQVSAMAFEIGDDRRSMRFAVAEASTISGILHASLYLDSIVLPYYTGLDALSKSIFSGECPSCVCRKVDLVPGGRLISYRGWSKTTMLIIGVLSSRILCKISGEKRFIPLIRILLEGTGWISIAGDVVYLMIAIPHENSIYELIIFGSICVLIVCNVFRKIYRFFSWHSVRRKSSRRKKKVDPWLSGSDIV